MADKQRSQIPMMPKGVEHAENEKQRLERLNRNIARRRALVAVESAIKGGFYEQSMIVSYLGLAKDSDIALALKVDLIEQVDNKLVLVSEIKEEMWREVEPQDNEKEEKKQKLTPPILPGCKCRNSDQSNPLYWLFTGWEVDGILEVAEYLNSLGISVYLEANGNNGNHRMKLPLWVKGQLINNSEMRWKDKQEEENNVINSLTSDPEAAYQGSGENFSWIQGETEISLAIR